MALAAVEPFVEPAAQAAASKALPYLEKKVGTKAARRITEVGRKALHEAITNPKVHKFVNHAFSKIGKTKTARHYLDKAHRIAREAAAGIVKGRKILDPLASEKTRKRIGAAADFGQDVGLYDEGTKRKALGIIDKGRSLYHKATSIHDKLSELNNPHTK